MGVRQKKVRISTGYEKSKGGNSIGFENWYPQISYTFFWKSPTYNSSSILLTYMTDKLIRNNHVTVCNRNYIDIDQIFWNFSINLGAINPYLKTILLVLQGRRNRESHGQKSKKENANLSFSIYDLFIYNVNTWGNMWKRWKVSCKIDKNSIKV